MKRGRPDNRTKEKEIGKTKPERTVYRNLFERIKQDEKEKTKENINKKEINSYIEEENLKTDKK